MTRARLIALGVLSGLMLLTPVPGLSPSEASVPSVKRPPAERQPMARQILPRTKRRLPRVPMPTAVVRDVRATPYPDHIRIVLDLERPITFTQMRHENPDRIMIELQDTLLGRQALARLAGGGMPDSLTINQSSPNVRMYLDLALINDYKLIPLKHPARLVLDLYPRPDAGETRLARTLSPPAVIPEVSPKPLPSAPPVARAGKREIQTIVIDAGHGGKDPGAVGRTGLAEKDITLQVSLLLRDMISRNLGKRVLMTRDHDVFVELEDRAKFANGHSADLFVSIHVNSHPQRATKGVEVYHFGEASDPRAMAVAARENGTPMETSNVGWQYLVADLLTDKKIEESLELAWTTKQAMVTHLDTHYDVVDHGVKTAPFYVLRYTAMPSILAEIAFITNPTEERLMQSDAFLSRIADSIYRGIKAFVTPLQTASR